MFGEILSICNINIVIVLIIGFEKLNWYLDILIEK